MVEDEISLGRTVKSWLELDGYVVDWLTNGELVESAVMTHAYVCILLDRSLPKTSGDEILRALRGSGNRIPVIILSARDGVIDRVEGLDLGADDYLPKPFDLSELSARLRALARRRSAMATTLLTHGDLALDPAEKRLTVAHRPVTLTGKEFSILHLMILRPGTVVSRAQIEEALYGWGDEVESNAIEVHIYNLRRKIGQRSIRTLRGLGYRLAE